MPVSGNRIENGDRPSEFEDIDIAEEELIDAYVRNQLSVEERKLLEKGLRTSPDLVNRLHFARLLPTPPPVLLKIKSFPIKNRKRLLPSRRKWWQFGLTWDSDRLLIGRSRRARYPCHWRGRPAGRLDKLASRITTTGGEQQAALNRQKLELEKSAAEQRLATDQITAQLREEQQKREADQQLIAELRHAQNQKQPPSAATVATFFLLRPYAPLKTRRN